MSDPLIHLVVKRAKDKPVQIQVQNIFNTDLSAPAFRLHCALLALSRDKDWVLYHGGIARLMGVHRGTLDRWVKELKEAKYLEIRTMKDYKGRFSGRILWQINELPQSALVQAWLDGEIPDGVGFKVKVTDLTQRQGQLKLL